VYYLLGEEFDRDLFLIFRLRGVEREELFGLLGGAAAPKGKGAHANATPTARASAPQAVPPSAPLSPEPTAFWGNEEGPECAIGEVRIPPVNAAFLKRLGSLPFWRGEERMADALEERYREAAVTGLDVFVGHPS
jgi:uncharacterized Zn finger protein